MSFLLRRIDVSTDLERAALRRIGHAVARLFARRPPRRPVVVVQPKASSYVVLDADALDAFGRREPAAYAVVVRMADLGARIVVPATAILGAGVHGDVPGGVTIVTLDAALAQKAARLVSETRLSLPFDAVLVACVPDGTPATIVTADAVAARAFARAAGRPDIAVVPLRP